MAKKKNTGWDGVYTDGQSRKGPTMGTPERGEITRLLSAWGQGEQAALGVAVPLIYAELRRLAHRHMRAQPLEHSLQTTALVNEAYLRLADARVKCKDRVHFRKRPRITRVGGGSPNYYG